MTDRDERGNRLSKRFQKDNPDADEDILDKEKSSPTSNPSNESKVSNESKLSNSSKTEETTKTEKKSVKDRPSVLMYLPDDLHTELDIRFDELNARHKREHGRPIEKNRDYYPAVIEAALENKDIEDVLDL